MNEVILIGRLAREPELSYTQNNTARCTFTLAVNRPQRNGEEQGADFIRVVSWNRQAETCDRYLRKGSQCAVEGKITTGSYTNRDGQKVYTTDVWASRVEFLGNSHREDDDYQPRIERQPKQQDIMTGFNDLPDTFQAAEDDIPF